MKKVTFIYLCALYAIPCAAHATRNAEAPRHVEQERKKIDKAAPRHGRHDTQNVEEEAPQHAANNLGTRLIPLFAIVGIGAYIYCREGEQVSSPKIESEEGKTTNLPTLDQRTRQVGNAKIIDTSRPRQAGLPDHLLSRDTFHHGVEHNFKVDSVVEIDKKGKITIDVTAQDHGASSVRSFFIKYIFKNYMDAMVLVKHTPRIDVGYQYPSEGHLWSRMMRSERQKVTKQHFEFKANLIRCKQICSVEASVFMKL